MYSCADWRVRFGSHEHTNRRTNRHDIWWL